MDNIIRRMSNKKVLIFSTIIYCVLLGIILNISQKCDFKLMFISMLFIIGTNVLMIGTSLTIIDNLINGQVGFKLKFQKMLKVVLMSYLVLLVVPFVYIIAKVGFGINLDITYLVVFLLKSIAPLIMYFTYNFIFRTKWKNGIKTITAFNSFKILMVILLNTLKNI